MPAIQPTERKFQTWVKKSLSEGDFWFSQLHPGLGCDVGVSDLLIGCKDASDIIPTELKIGSLSDNRLHVSEVRPAQVRWHSNLNSFGHCSILLVGVWATDRWHPYAVDCLNIERWQDGFCLMTEAKALDPQHLGSSFEEFVLKAME